MSVSIDLKRVYGPSVLAVLNPSLMRTATISVVDLHAAYAPAYYTSHRYCDDFCSPSSDKNADDCRPRIPSKSPCLRDDPVLRASALLASRESCEHSYLRDSPRLGWKLGCHPLGAAFRKRVRGLSTSSRHVSQSSSPSLITNASKIDIVGKIQQPNTVSSSFTAMRHTNLRSDSYWAPSPSQRPSSSLSYFDISISASVPRHFDPLSAVLV